MEFEPYLEQANQENKRFIQRSVTKTIRYWWLILTSVLISCIVAFLIIRYASKIYSIGAKVMIENSNESIDPTSFLFGDQLLGNNQEVVNELIIIKSYPIIRKSVIDQGQNIHYYRTTTALERVIQIEPDDSPFTLKALGTWSNEGDLEIKDPIQVVMNDAGISLLNGSEVLAQDITWGKPFQIDEKEMVLLQNMTFDSEMEGVDYFFKLKSIEEAVHNYQEKINVSIAEEKSSIISINMEAMLPRKEVAFLGKVLTNYLQSNLDEKNQGASNTINFINKELASIKDSLKKIEGRLEVFKSRNQISNLQSEGQRIFEKLLELEEERAQFQVREKYLDLIEEYLATDDGSKLVTPSSFGIDDASLNTLTESLLKLETERSLMGRDSESEIALQMDARIRELRKALKNYVENVAKSNKLQLNEVNKRMALIESTIEDLPVSEMALMNIERLHKLSESLYLLLLEKKAEAEITRSSNTPDIKMIESARKLSGDPIKPNKKLVYGGFFLLGLALPFAWILISVFLDKSIRTKEEITRALDLPFMGYIASADGKPRGYVLQQPKSRLAETFRTLRSNLKYLAKKDGAQVILISSCFPGEGKTFVSTNLALSVASAGKKVLVIGADLRKPQLQTDFQLDNSKGLSNYLSGSMDQSEVITHTNEGVDVIVSGPVPPNPLELLDSERFYTMLQEFRSSYDYIIIDTSPFVLVSDATALFRKADINLLVLRSGVSNRDNLQIIKELATESKDCSFGLVLNDHNLTNEYGYRYGKGYNSGYGYYQD